MMSEVCDARSSHAIGAGQSLHGTEFSMPAAAAAGTPNGLTSAFQLPGVTAESMKVVSTSVAEHLRASERAVRCIVSSSSSSAASSSSSSSSSSSLSSSLSSSTTTSKTHANLRFGCLPYTANETNSISALVGKNEQIRT
eukprot:4691086-Amphidinium_carterae.1